MGGTDRGWAWSEGASTKSWVNPIVFALLVVIRTRAHAAQVGNLGAEFSGANDHVMSREEWQKAFSRTDVDGTIGDNRVPGSLF